jgi:hypothetical protein
VLGDPVRQLELELELEVVALVVGDAVAAVALVLLLEHALERSQMHEASLCSGRAVGQRPLRLLVDLVAGRVRPARSERRPDAAGIGGARGRAADGQPQPVL